MIVKLFKDYLYKKGYKINKVSKLDILNENHLIAIKKSIGNNPVLFDIGANNGQTVTKFRKVLTDSYIHSFEPSKLCFKILSETHINTENLKINNKAVGNEKGSLVFNEYSASSLNSLLKRSFTKSSIIDNYPVEIITVDDYCTENKIEKINLLKTDTEGFELNVLKGANRMFDENKIQFVYVEIFFFENYIGQSSFGDIYNLLINKGYNLVRFYVFEYTDKGYASRTDALFVNPNFVN